MANLSKSKYITYCQCPKALWLKQYKPEEMVIDPLTQARFDAGTEVGELAKRLFGDFVEATTYKTAVDGTQRLDLGAMAAATQKALAEGAENIAEAAFIYDGCYCAVDLLHKTPHGYAIYEVKSSTNLNELEVYAQDVAYQKYVLTNCGLNITGTYLVNINNEYVLNGEIDVKEYFLINDISEAVAEEYAKVAAQTKAAKKVLEGAEPKQHLAEHCRKPYACAFWNYCSNNIIPSPSVFDLYRMSFKKALEHMNEGRLSLEDMRQEKLTDLQQLQLECTLGNTSYINKKAIGEFLKKLSYPLYFLDFETEQTVIPKYQGTHPYQQVTFQYSLHYIEHEGGELKHREFLGISGEDPRRALAEQLCKDIPLNVCTTAYNKAFECTRLKELAEAFPDLAPHLLNIESHIVDLLDPFRAGYYYMPAMNGSFSIKKVLPALFPDDPELDYHNLSGGVQNGGEAMSIYPQIQFMEPEAQKKARRALLDYCCLDTLAMVKLWEKLREVSEEKTTKTFKNMMNNSFIANCPQNEDKAIENLLNAFIDNLDKKSKEQYRQVRNILEKKIEFNTDAEKNFLPLLVKLIASGRIDDCKKMIDLVRHSVYVYKWPKKQKSYSTYCNKFIDFLEKLLNSTSKKSTGIKKDITSKCTTPALTGTEEHWLKEAFQGYKVYSHEQLMKKFTARLRSQDRISGNKVWLPLRYISKLYKKNGKAKEFSDWLNNMAEEIFVHYKDDKKEIKSVQFKTQQVYLVFKENSECKGTYDVYVALSRENKKYEAYTPTGEGNTKVPMTVTDISDIAIDHVKPIDQTLRDLNDAGKIENLKKVSDAYQKMIKKSQNSDSNAENASLDGLNVDIDALTNELNLIREDGVLRLMHTKYNGKKSNSSTYKKIIKIENKNTYYGILGKVIIDGEDEEKKRYLYYNLKEQNAPMRVALKELNGTEVQITKAIIDYI